MAGQGSPHSRTARGDFRACLGRRAIQPTILALFLLQGGFASAQELSLRLRLEWGGGQARQWSGSMEARPGTLSDPQRLGARPENAASLRLQDGRLHVASRSPAIYGGVDVTVSAAADSVFHARFVDADGKEAAFEVPLSQLITDVYHQPLGDGRNWLMIRRSPGDRLRIQLDRPSLVFAPDEPWRLTFRPEALGVKAGTQVDYDVELRHARGGAVIRAFETESQVASSPQASMPAIPLQFNVPTEPGVYDLSITASTQRLRLGPLGRNWLRDVLAKRTAQFIVVSPTRRTDLQPTSREAV
ncbi:MAG: hypothetical protein N2C14_31235, partial [Planctomycetales bacterium]